MLTINGFTITVDLRIPQLDDWETKLMAALDPIRATIASVAQDLATEIGQINEKLGMATTPEEIADVQSDLEALRASIVSIIPDEPPPAP